MLFCSTTSFLLLLPLASFQLISFFSFCRLESLRSLGLWQFSSHRYENILHLFALLGWALHIGKIFLFAKLIYFLHWNRPLVLKIWLVANKEKYSIFLCIHLNLIHPKLDYAIEWCDICNIKNQQNSLTSSVISTCNCPESLLSCGVPYLKLNVLGIDL